MYEKKAASDTIMACILPLVPSSVTTLILDYSDLDIEEWTEFFWSHPEVRSIESKEEEPVSESLWNALSPAGADAVTPCPKLESISLPKERASTPLLNCLLNRKIAGYGLRHLRLRGVDDGLAEKLRFSVEKLRIIYITDEPIWVRPVSMGSMDRVLITSQWEYGLPQELEDVELDPV